MLNLLLTWIVTALSLLLITRLDIGITVRDFGTALIAAVVIGLVNGILGPILGLLALPLTILTLGLFAFVVNALLFWAAAGLVKGFSLRNGFWSALLGSVVLSLCNSLIFWLLGLLGIGR
jgi:putative membrane protein